MPVVLCLGLVAQVLSASADAAPLKALIVNGQMNKAHDWKVSSPILKRILEQTGLFKVDFATSPPKGGNMENFKPDFAAYDVMVLDYDGDYWSEQTKKAFVKYVKSGGGVVVYHSADNAFPKWKEYNEIIGLGGWGGRNEKSGPYIRWRDGKIVRDMSPGRGGSHPPQHDYQVIIRQKEHPITKGLPEKWMHTKDELYSQLRGPAKNLTVLATAYADPKKRGSGEHEPVLFTVNYGKGRMFHTVLGHAKRLPVPCMECVGFIVTFQRGAEWAATGKVTQKVPDDFPTATELRVRKNLMRVPAKRGPKEKPVVNSGKGSEMAKLQELLEKVKTYDWGQSRLALTEVSDIIKASYGSPAKLRDIEKSLIGVLKSDATYAGKQYVCRELSIIGTEQSVPVLASMLTNQEYSDMARYALERIPDKAADNVLLAAMLRAEGMAKIGIVNSLGERGYRPAAGEIGKLVDISDRVLAGAAISALGKIGGPDAVKPLDKALQSAPENQKMLVYDAYLKIADKMVAEGDKNGGMKIYVTLNKQGVPSLVRTAAMKGMTGAAAR